MTKYPISFSSAPWPALFRTPATNGVSGTPSGSWARFATMKRPMSLAAAVLAMLVSLSACTSENEAAQNTAVQSQTADQLPKGTSEGSADGQLKGFSLSINGDGLITVNAEGPTPSDGVVLYSVTVDGYQLGLKSIDGNQSVFVFDFDSSRQSNLSSSLTYVDGQVSFRVPSAEVPRLTVPFEWTGTLSINGTDVAKTGSVTHQ